MDDFAALKASAERKGTQKLLKFRKTLRKFILGVTAIVLLIAATYFWQQHREHQSHEMETHTIVVTPDVIPLVTSPTLMWAKLALPTSKDSRSAVIPLPLGMHYISARGNGIRLHTMYLDKPECSSVVGGKTCPDGSVVGYFITNEKGGENIVSYAFVPE